MAEAARAAAEAEGAAGVDLIERAGRLLHTAEEILSESRAEKDRTNAIRAIRECARTIEVIGKLQGTISDGTQVNIIAAPVVLELQQAVLTALAPYPAARHAVIAALSGVSGPPMIEHAA